MRILGKLLTGLFVLCLFGPTLILAQDAEEKSSFITYVEEQLSTDSFRIGLNGLEGTLSSNVSLRSITLSDKQGVWLTIEKPQLVWSRASLLSGKVDIESLTAERIDYVRNPVADESLPAPEASPLALPDLPVAVILNKLAIGRVTFAEQVFGLQAEASVDGKMVLDGGSLDLDLAIKRLDGPGGELTTTAKYLADTKNLELLLRLSEPENGIMANLLNLQGNPPVALEIAGNAPITDLKVNLAFDVDARRILDGKLQLDGQDAGTLARADLSGPLSAILPEQQREFFGPSSRLNAEVLVGQSGAVDVKSFTLNSGAIDLSASARTLSDGFLSALKFDLNLSPQSGSSVVLPIRDGDATLSKLDLEVSYDAENQNSWNGTFDAQDLRRDGIAISRVNLTANGVVDNIADPQARSLTFDISGLLSEFNSNDPALNEAVGRDVRLQGNGSWRAAQPLQLSDFKVGGETFSFTSTGQFAEAVFDGEMALQATRLAAFAALADRQLRGSADLRTRGKIEPLTGGFDLKVDGTTSGLSVGEPALEKLLAGETALSGGVARGEKGIEFDALRIANAAFETNLDGRFASDFADLKADALIRDIATLSDAASGAVKLKATLAGESMPFEARVDLGMTSGRLQNRDAKNLIVAFDGTVTSNTIAGEFSGGGLLDDKPVSIAAKLAASDETVDLRELLAEIGATNISGNLKRERDGLVDAVLNIDSSDIGDVAALALVDASGAVRGAFELFQTDGMQSAKTDIVVKSLRYEDYRVGAADIDVAIVDLFGKPKVGATLDARDVLASGIAVRKLDGTVGTEGEITDFNIRAAFEQNEARIETRGQLRQGQATTEISLETLSLTSNITEARLRSPTKVTIQNGRSQLTGAQLIVGTGSVGISGTAGEKLDLSVDVNALPLSIINAVRPQTRASGVVSGKLDVRGAPSRPEVIFAINGNGVSVSELAAAGINPLSVNADGRFANQSVRFERLRITNAQNISLTASGTVPLSGAGLDFRAEGTAPLDLARSALASRGASVTGSARFDLAVRGSLQRPQASGLLSVSNGTFTDPLSNLKLLNIGLLAGFNGDRININRGQASLSSGGTVSVAGSVGITGDLPANLSITLANARYTDAQTFDARASGQLTVTGALLRDPVLGGTINLGRTDITVPESFAADSKLLKVKHVAPSATTRRTLTRLNRATPVTRPTSRPSILNLNLVINAPNQIFVRGRGLDAELGGRIRLTGPVTSVQPLGRFTLRRGRLAILGQRIDLTSGTITLAGDLDPIIDLTATTRAGDTEAYIRLKGRASNIEVTFSSSPELPQDEVLALIIFGRGLGDLSPAQIARLASIAAELTGGSSPGLVDSIRQGTGLDDLDIVQDSDGNAAVKAGKYINDNVYLGVQAGSKSEATINLDLSDSVTARGAVSSDGDTSIGIFLERDY